MKTLRVRKLDILFGVLCLFLCGIVVGVGLSEVERHQRYRDRLESLNGTLDTIGRR